jgi:hypothetical protein
MKRLAVLFPIALALGAIIFVPGAGAREPTPIKACQTISQPGSYELANNLTFTGIGNCLLITADFVTIDLGGFTISGSGTAFGIAGAPSGPRLRGIAVRNGSISGFVRGVELSNADGSIVEGLRVVGGNTGAECQWHNRQWDREGQYRDLLRGRDRGYWDGDRQLRRLKQRCRAFNWPG